MLTKSIKDWGLGVDTKKPILIAGPCSAETEEQLIETCKQIASKTNTSILRAGIWKPRTRPNSFEGVGKIGLPWLNTVKQQTQLPVTIEVANTAHVELALKAGIDVLWIGARTTVNPFAVQEIADSLKGIDIPVMVKNPINPDLELWIGAMERLHLAGINKLAAIHRGFSVVLSGPYRNLPKWDYPIELRRRIPGLQVICDPSHICGKRALLQGVAQKAMDLDFDGLMLESHINPDQAWSDAAQQVTPDDLKKLIDALLIRKPASSDPLFIDKLDSLRGTIDHLDQNILKLLGQRMEIATEIGKYKKENNIAVLDLERWKTIFDTRMKMAGANNLSELFADGLLQAIHQESIKKQTDVMNNSMIEE